MTEQTLKLIDDHSLMGEICPRSDPDIAHMGLNPHWQLCKYGPHLMKWCYDIESVSFHTLTLGKAMEWILFIFLCHNWCTQCCILSEADRCQKAKCLFFRSFPPGGKNNIKLASLIGLIVVVIQYNMAVATDYTLSSYEA